MQTSAKEQTPKPAGNNAFRIIIFTALAILCLTPFISAPVALLLGILLANTIGHPLLRFNSRATKILLQISVVGLGFGMNAFSALKAGKEGIAFTVGSIFTTLLLGYGLGKILKTERKTSFLLSSGTAICGGSAIAAVSPVIGANEQQISVALGTVFILNSAALFLFPPIGQLLHLSETQFGLWAAIAIHDTSSVAGAAGRYGQHALEVATTVKLARALWIIPVSLGTSLLFKTGSGKVKIPWFIFMFVAAMLLNTYIPQLHPFSRYVVTASQTSLTLTLFLIGAGLSFSTLKAVGVRPLLQGIILWVIISTASLWAILHIAPQA